MPSSPPLAVPLKEGRALAGRALNRLERSEAALRLAVAGEVRRMAPWVERVDLLATAHDADPLLDAFADAPFVADVLERGARALVVKSKDAIHARLEVVEEAHFGAALLRATGPASYVHSLHTLARARRLRWEGDRLLEGAEERGGPEEAEVFAALGLPWQPPERRGRGSLEEGTPPGLLEMRDVVGVAGLHVGRYSATDLGMRAHREGYAWAVLSDERPDADRRDSTRFVSPREELAAEAALTDLTGYVLRIGKGGEPSHLDADAMVPDGLCLAYLGDDAPADDVWRTDLLVRAARHPLVDVVCLRLPSSAADEPRALDVGRLLDACGRAGVALGIPPPPFHPDPEPDLLETAARRGIPLLLLAEARDLVSVDDLILTVGLARRAGVPRSLVLNTFDVKGLLAWVALRRTRGST